MRNHTYLISPFQSQKHRSPSSKSHVDPKLHSRPFLLHFSVLQSLKRRKKFTIYNDRVREGR